jgi:hypothetical protein
MSTHAFANPFRPYNPFIASNDDTLVEIEDVADAREASYALVQSGPAVAPEEVESHLDAVGYAFAGARRSSRSRTSKPVRASRSARAATSWSPTR